MIDLGENKRMLQELESEVKSMGDSLWLKFFEKYYRRIRKWDNARWFLEW